MHGRGERTLARAAFPGQQDVCVHSGSVLSSRNCLLERRARSNQLIERSRCERTLFRYPTLITRRLAFKAIAAGHREPHNLAAVEALMHPRQLQLVLDGRPKR